MPWLLNFTNANFGALNGGGRPWADGTAMAGRAQNAPPNNVPWDNGCRVTTYVDGLAAMSAMRTELENAIAGAAGQPPANRGLVYIAGWRFNCMRDLSVANPWLTDPWNANQQAANPDRTAMGLVVRLLAAGVTVRIMVWLPTVVQGQVGPGDAHILDHYLAARIVGFESNRVAPGQVPPLGVVALDARTADKWSGSHHQKMMVIRGPATNVAFVGGVDLAYTRRSAPTLTDGDWQSGQTIPDPSQWWPQQATVNYAFRQQVPVLNARQVPDLPVQVYGNSTPPPAAPVDRQMWHDQHLKLEGPIVATIEQQFRERWVDQAAMLSDLTAPGNLTSGQVIFSTALAYNAGVIAPLPAVTLPVPVAPPAAPAPVSQVQMWRTIPLRNARSAQQPPATLFKRGEFTVMAGISNAVLQARELIWMFDQYFWNLPLARLLNAHLNAIAGLRVIVILPPYADGSYGTAHLARKNAIRAMLNNVGNRVGVYNMWSGNPGRGIYVHAKSHTYDNQLLVCGSANLNRRSFLCDTELACAVLDPAVVTPHQQALWGRLFPNAAWPAINQAVAGWGAQFYTAFQAAANTANSLLTADQWYLSPPVLPNGVQRPVDATLPAYYDAEFEPSSVNVKVEKEQRLGRDPGLDDVVWRLENETGFFGGFPWRKP